MHNFVGEFPDGTQYNLELMRSTKISIEEQKEELSELMEKYKEELKNESLTEKTIRYYIQSIRLTS